jgi:hypothetical protein
MWGAVTTEAQGLRLLGPVREAAVTNLFALTNAPDLTPQEAVQARALHQARRIIDRTRGRGFGADLRALANVSLILNRAFPEGEFSPVLQEAITGYQTGLDDVVLVLSTNAAALPPTPQSLAVITALNQLRLNLGALDLADTARSSRELLRLSNRLRGVENVLLRLRAAPSNRREAFSARMNGQPFVANDEFASGANYNPALSFLTVTGRELLPIPGASRTIKLFIGNVVPGTTTHQIGFPSAGTYAFYAETTPNGSVGLNSIGGSAVITLDLLSGTVRGRFSFEAADTLGQTAPVRVTAGEFLLPIE